MIILFSFVLKPLLSQNYAINLDGTGDDVNISSHSDFNLSSALSIQVWAKPAASNGTGNHLRIICRNENGNAGNSQDRWMLSYDPTNKVDFDLDNSSNGGNGIESSSTLSTSSWKHIVLTFSSGTAKLYINASLETTGSLNLSSLNHITAGDLRIGSEYGSQEFNGLLDGVCLWDEAITSSEITALYNSGNGINPTSNEGNYTSSNNIIAYYDFQQNLNDTSTNSHNGSSNGNPTYTNVNTDLTLPVELTSFDILSSRNNSIILQWVTESEINNLGFNLDRKTPITDWTQIASYVTHPELQGQGSVSHQTIYTFTDNTVQEYESYDYRLSDVDYDGNVEYHSLQLMGVSSSNIPEQFVLYPNYPNPFNPVTTIRYDLSKESFVDIKIYDMLGNVVNNLLNTNQSSGYKSVQWNATNYKGAPVSAGLYLYTIQAGKFRQTKKMVLLK